MSLFDVIRYPISDPPTRGELLALPPSVRNKIEDLICCDIEELWPETVRLLFSRKCAGISVVPTHAELLKFLEEHNDDNI